MTAPAVPYAGIATRAVALAIDVAIAHVIVFAGGAILALVGSLVADIRADTIARLLAAGAWVTVVGVYFVLFWSTAGQTPGMRLHEPARDDTQRRASRPDKIDRATDRTRDSRSCHCSSASYPY